MKGTLFLSMAAVAFLALSPVVSMPAVAGETPSPPGARVWIIWPKDGEIITGGKLWVRMGAKGIGIAPAGVIKKKTGHQHLIIDRPLPPFDEDIPADKNHLHFGGGQTEARIELPPGKHTLQLLLGDFDHIPHDPPLYSQRITVIVP
jgi:Domain of unknown function (DUF4399)